MPFVIYVIGFGVFAQGTSEFMLSRLLPSVAGDLHVSLSEAGLLVSAFAVGLIGGAPLLTLATLGETRTLGGAINIAAFNVGIALAPWMSGLVIEAGPGLAAIGWVGAAFALGAVGSTLLDRRLTRHHQRGTTRIVTAAVPEAAQATAVRR